MSSMSINKHYNFSVYANSILGTSYTNTKLVSILDYHTALKFANVELLHRQVFPYLPPNTLLTTPSIPTISFSITTKQSFWPMFGS